MVCRPRSSGNSGVRRAYQHVRWRCSASTSDDFTPGALEWVHGNVRRAPGPQRQTDREQERPDGEVREVPEGDAGPGCATLAWRDRPARFCKRRRAGVEALGRAPEDDPQRVPVDALAEGRPGTDPDP